MDVEVPCYTLINFPKEIEPPNEIQLKLNLEKGSVPIKIETLKRIILYISNGERLPGILMHIIQFVMPSEDKCLKKLMLIFWEIVPKTRPDGTLLQEIILVCDAYRKDLEHPNEFIRGATLRFLCKLKEPELLAPLMSPIRKCLEHRTSYVRRNAVLAIFTIYKNFPSLIPDASELVLRFLEAERDVSCKRNAFLMLLHTDLERAWSYLVFCLDEVTSFGDILQLMVVQLMNKVCLENPQERSRFIGVIYNLLNSSSPAVRYEASGTLLSLTNAPTAIKSAASCYIDIITKESDNNIKLIVLERLILLRENPNHERVLQEIVMDLLRVLSCSDIVVKEKTLNLILDLTSQKYVNELVSVLKKETLKISTNPDQEDGTKYLQLFLKSLHVISLKFKNVASTIVVFVMGFLSSETETISYDVILFIKEIIHKIQFLRPIIINKLLDNFMLINFLNVHRVALWILGEYVGTLPQIGRLLGQIKCSLGNIPLIEDEIKLIIEENSLQKNEYKPCERNSSSVYSSRSSAICLKRPLLRQYLLSGGYIIGVVVSTTLVKLSIKYKVLSREEKCYNCFLSEALLIISSILNFGKCAIAKSPMTNDDSNRMLFCIKVLLDCRNCVKNIFSNSCYKAYIDFYNSQKHNSLVKYESNFKSTNQVDDTVIFSQLSSLTKFDIDPENFSEVSLIKAVNGKSKKNSFEYPFGDRKITQLTGYSDPVYAEAWIQPNQFDVIVEVLIVNQTEDLLQNCTLELDTLGHLKLVEKPQSCMLSPHDFCWVKATIKVSSTENGFIFGKISYDINGQPDKGIVDLNEIHIDIAEHLHPVDCTESQFRKMWAEFEWENKIQVDTRFTDLQEFLSHIQTLTNMNCLTPGKVFQGSCSFLAANLYARSIFGEDALVNISLEKLYDIPKATISGHIRIRAKSQGMALYLGDMINRAQRK